MPLAISAKISCMPGSILKSRWAHDMAHDMLRAKIMAEKNFRALKKR